MILMKKFGWASILSGSVIDSYMILSRASDALEMISRKKYLFVGVESVNDQAHQLLNVGIESKSF